MRRRALLLLVCLGAGLGLAGIAFKLGLLQREPAPVAVETRPETDLITAAIGEALGYTPAALRLRRSCMGFAWGASETQLIAAGASHLEHDGIPYFGKSTHAFAGRDFRAELFAEDGLTRMRLTLKDVGDDDYGVLHRQLVDDYGAPAIDVPLDEGDWTGRSTGWTFGRVGLQLQVAKRKTNGAAEPISSQTVLTLSCEKREAPAVR
jgi:hypothetical protein